MAQLALIADDLTGALDAVAPFANAGLRSVVATGPDRLEAALQTGAAVVGVSTNSREGSAQQAAQSMQVVAGLLEQVPQVFKKIDSRLKGHVQAEVLALAALRNIYNILICPAIPDMGRIVRAGSLQGFGVAEPVAIGFDGGGLQPLVPDAETDADIDRILAQAAPDTLLVGARGLSAGLARRMAIAPLPPQHLSLPHPIAFVIGSRDPITMAQVDKLRQDCPAATHLPAPNGATTARLPQTPVVILQATQGAVVAAPAEVTAALATTALHALPTGIATLVLTGGETAAAVLAAMAIGLLEVKGEILPGLPLCQALDFPSAPLILAKSGGFGAADTLCRLLYPLMIRSVR